MKILVVEDEPITRRVVASSVKSLGHETLIASDGAEAWAIYCAQPIDVVITDWKMQGIDGIELCHRIRRSREQEHYTYIFLTSTIDNVQAMIRGLEAGADDYITKPIDVDSLSARLISARRVTSLHEELANKTRELQELNDRLQEISQTDALTQVHNRLRLEQDLPRICEDVQRYGRDVTLVLSDLDRFKEYNDRYGHLKGDDALRQVGQRLRSTVRVGDEVYRYGGEEFLVILREARTDDLEATLTRLREAVSELGIEHLGNAPFDVMTLSVGAVSLRPGQPVDVDASLRAADLALYEAKAAGRNCQRIASLHPNDHDPALLNDST